MADIPQDPRQLARDILSGKVKLEDLQREQQRRQAGQARPAARPPEDRPVPLPKFERRKPPAAPANQQETMPMPVPLPSRQQPAPPPPRPAQNRPQQRPQPTRVVKEPPKPVRQMPPAAPVETQRRADQAPATVANAARDEANVTRKVIRSAMKQKSSLRHAILLSEILLPPVSMREER